MKNLKQLIGNNLDLLDIEEVNNLVKYIRELEDDLIELKQSQSNNNELLYKDVIFEIYKGIKDGIKHDEEHERFNEIGEFNWKLGMKNLKDYLEEFFRNNNIYE